MERADQLLQGAAYVSFNGKYYHNFTITCLLNMPTPEIDDQLLTMVEEKLKSNNHIYLPHLYSYVAACK